MPSAKVAPEPDLVEGSGRYPVEPEASASRGKRTSATAWHDAFGEDSVARRSEPSITEESGADDREAMLHRWSTRERAEHAAWNRVMHNDPAGGVVRGAKTKMSVHMKNDKKETHDARKLKRFSSIIHVRVVHHLADHTERAVLLECVDGVYLTQLTKMVQEALKQPKVRLLWLSAEGETIVLDSQRVFDQFAGEEWCVQPWVLHVHEDSPKATHALALHDASRALFERCAIRRAIRARNSGAIRRKSLRRSVRSQVRHQRRRQQAGRRASDLAAVGDAEQARVRIVTHAAQLRTAPPLAALKEEVGGGDGKGRRRGSLFGWIKRSTKNLFG